MTRSRTPELNQVDRQVRADPDEDESRERRYHEADLVEEGCRLVLAAFRGSGAVVTALWAGAAFKDRNRGPLSDRSCGFTDRHGDADRHGSVHGHEHNSDDDASNRESA